VTGERGAQPCLNRRAFCEKGEVAKPCGWPVYPHRSVGLEVSIPSAGGRAPPSACNSSGAAPDTSAKPANSRSCAPIGIVPPVECSPRPSRSILATDPRSGGTRLAREARSRSRRSGVSAMCVALPTRSP
jgi:hypothetical protein